MITTFSVYMRFIEVHIVYGKMLFVILTIFMQIGLGELCDICVTQPLITSNIECPICSTLDGECKTDSEEMIVEEENKNSGYILESDESNPHNWTTCDVSTPTCNPLYKYRSFDGSCNNLEHPTWGVTNTAYTRILPSNYRDGKHLIRRDVDGEDLPLVRQLSTTLFIDGDAHDKINLMAMQWGQVVAHDIALTPTLEYRNCCNPSTYNEEFCLPFIYPPDDHFYSQFNITCDNLRRNKFTQVGDTCGNGPAQQIDRASHPIDGSLIYGSDLATANLLRSFSGGRLKTRTLHDGRAFLPNVAPEEVTNNCVVLNKEEPCYIAGDVRVNQSPEHSAISNMLQRAHNNMADQLAYIHINWDDEKLYQETRRILVAILQHIHYKEWLQFYLGKTTMVQHKLYPKARGYTDYNSKINLIAINSFHNGAFRIGHSGIQGLLKMYNHENELDNTVAISDWMDRPLIVEEGCNYDKFLLGLVHQPMQKFDNLFTYHTTNLLQKGFKPYGKDLVSTDIMRGRDNGLAPYVHYLEVCTGVKVTTFDSLIEFIPKQAVDILKIHYKTVEDIDMFVGGALESYVADSRLGPTFLCIFTEQFYRMKWGDRFWYEVQGQPHSFTIDQLQEIRKMTVSKLICDNSDNIKKMPTNSFKPISESNPIRNCDDIPGINLYKF